MSRVILFEIALLALPVALVAFAHSGRRVPVPAPVPADAPAAPVPAPGPAQPPRAAPEVAARLHELAFGVPLRPPAGEPAHREAVAAVDLLLSGPVLKAEYAPAWRTLT